MLQIFSKKTAKRLRVYARAGRAARLWLSYHAMLAHPTSAVIKISPLTETYWVSGEGR
jgi:hypothetical protein